MWMIAVNLHPGTVRVDEAVHDPHQEHLPALQFGLQVVRKFWAGVVHLESVTILLCKLPQVSGGDAD